MVSWISGKRAENSKIWDFQESYTAAKVHVAAKGSHVAAWPRRRKGSVSGSPWRSYCS